MHRPDAAVHGVPLSHHCCGQRDEGVIRARQESLASAQQASQQIEEEIARDQEYNGDAEPGSLDEITKMLAPKAQAAEERARSDAAVNEASRQVAAAEDELKRVQLDAEGACRAFVLGCCIRTLVTQCCLDVFCVTLSMGLRAENPGPTGIRTPLLVDTNCHCTR